MFKTGNVNRFSPENKQFQAFFYKQIKKTTEIIR